MACGPAADRTVAPVRCHPFAGAGFDPVPPTLSAWRAGIIRGATAAAPAARMYAAAARSPGSAIERRLAATRVGSGLWPGLACDTEWRHDQPTETISEPSGPGRDSSVRYCWRCWPLYPPARGRGRAMGDAAADAGANRYRRTGQAQANGISIPQCRLRHGAGSDPAARRARQPDYWATGSGADPHPHPDTVIVMDSRGHGRSTRDARPYAMT